MGRRSTARCCTESNHRATLRFHRLDPVVRYASEDHLLFVDAPLVGPDLFQYVPDFVIVHELIALEEIADDRCIESSTLVRVDERVVCTEGPEVVIRFLVDCIRCRPDASRFDVVQCELDVLPSRRGSNPLPTDIWHRVQTSPTSESHDKK